MKNAFAFLSRLLLMGCLIVYGPLTMAASGGDGAIFSMEICADGHVQTIRVDASGTPVGPAEDCYDCPTCCNGVAADLGLSCGAGLSLVLLDVLAGCGTLYSPIYQKPKNRPMPRAPPMFRLSILTTMDPIATDHPDMGLELRSDGRSVTKDAHA